MIAARDRWTQLKTTRVSVHTKGCRPALKFEETGKYLNFVHLYITRFPTSTDTGIYKILAKYFYTTHGDTCSASLCNFALFFFNSHVTFKFTCVGVLFGNQSLQLINMFRRCVIWCFVQIAPSLLQSKKIEDV